MSLSSTAPRPDVSVIMPVFNKLELTQVCLESIWKIGADASFEILVVDNGSTDGSRQWLQEQHRLGHLNLLPNQENLGFARGCNLGANAARGRHLLFLNNDMQVLPGWLDPLVATLDRDPRVGIVGAKLLFPDNTIQHAGVAFIESMRDGKPSLGGIHIGYRKPAGMPSANRPQYNQIVTGACLLIRSELFGDLGGFDEGFWNGNEDVDLCLKAGERGWQVVYRPESQIYHFESQSGPERWTRTDSNIQRLNDRWQGRAHADFTQARPQDSFRPTEHLAIRTYVGPRVRLDRPTGRTAGQPVVSVVVLTWNALEYTRQCAASLLEHTDPRHELIFVDNGSRPDTVAFLERLERENPTVKVILNDSNLGFAAGNNVGIAASKGDYVCLLNSDTVVTAGWLDALLRPAEQDAQVGLVGPVTNSISGDQKLPAVPYDEDTLVGMEAFAAERACQQAGSTRPALMIVGFCMLMKKSLIERIGGLDEGFGQGNYEDTDYCLRTLLAGFRTVVALDSFVHHFGSRSFAAGKVDYAAQIDEKFAIFRRKWGLAAQATSTASLDLDRLLQLGFVEPLHFCRLPDGDGACDLAPAGWEIDRWLKQGEAFFKQGNLQEAERIFRFVLGWQPDNLHASNDLACALWQSGSPAGIQEAAAILEGVLERDPGNEDARWNLEQFQATAT